MQEIIKQMLWECNVEKGMIEKSDGKESGKYNKKKIMWAGEVMRRSAYS